MPVFLNAKYPGPERRSGLNWPRVQPGALEEQRSTFLHMGLVNNMADGALGATEHQFLTLLEAAARDMLVHVTLYALPEVERKPMASATWAAFTRALSSFGNSRPSNIRTG